MKKHMARRSRGIAGAKAQLREEPVGARRALLAYLKGILLSLNPTDRLIAECVLADPEMVITSSIATLKDKCGASVGAIVGFCRRLGLAGFADFKIALARDLAQSGLSASGARENGSLFDKVFHFHAQSLDETLKVNREDAFERVARALEKARRIELFSIGLSWPIAYTAYCKFRLIGLPVAAEVDSHMQLIAASRLKSGDVAFGISCSGTTRETVDCLKVAKTRGATTVCLTNAMKSPITEQCDLRLYATPSEIKYFQAPLASRITQLAVIDALFVSLSLRQKNKIVDRLQQSAEELLRHRLK
jgi:RpiR family transcriptional regulator, carbohydrate utilization regulator